MNQPDPSAAQQRFELFFREHYSAALKYALRRAPTDLAREAVADAFLVAWRRFDEVNAPDRAWLLGVTRRTLANHLRSQRRRHSLLTRLREHDSFEPASSEASFENTEILTALRSLRPQEREAVLLVAWDGLDQASAATVAGCSPVAFRVRLHRARAKLKTHLDSQQALPAGARTRTTGEA